MRILTLLAVMLMLGGCGFKLAEPFSTGYYERRGGVDTGYASPSSANYHHHHHHKD